MKPGILSHPLSFKGMALATAVVAGFSLGEARAKSADLDGDGIANLVDSDLDGDGIPNGRDLNADGGVCRRGPLKGKYVGDHLSNDDPNEKDIDADGLKDSSLAELDIDGDGRKDDAAKEKDIDGDGRADDADSDIDGDGLGNGDWNEDDIDGDGVSDQLDNDCDGDGRDRDHDGDDDADGISDDDDGDDDGNWIANNFQIDGSGTMVIDLPETILGPGSSPTGDSVINVSMGAFSGSSSATAISLASSFDIRSSVFELVKWLESVPPSDRDIDPLLFDSLWEIIPREDSLLTDRVRRLRDSIVEESPVEEIPVIVDETAPAP